MDFLVNFSPTGEGIQSVMSDNLTCTCDYSSCNCFHNNFHYTEPERIQRKDGEDPILTETSLLLIPVYPGMCDDHCVLSLTISASLLIACGLVVTAVCGKG